MVFSSISFLIYFLPLVIGMYYLAPTGLKNIVLLVTSLFFYAWGEPIYVLLMIFSIVFNYGFGIFLHRFRTAKGACLSMKVLMGLNIAVNLGILGFFKYGDFLIVNINESLGTSLNLLELPLPIGISFYTFQAMSYIIDLYRGKVNVQRNLVAFGTYVALFPQLIAGPIVRFKSIEYQLVDRHVDIQGFSCGVRRFVIGMAKKVLLANNIGMLWENVSALGAENTAVFTAWMGALAFTMQIYFDFSGYSDMAIGLGKMFGFDFPENFNYPYISKSITEFWRRWHISLSSWFKEYLYVPLGGNRKGMGRQIMNIFIVWSLTGMWHGAGWNFIIWGVYFAVLLIGEKLIIGKAMQRLEDKYPMAGSVLSHVYTMLFVIVSWVIFATEDLSVLPQYLKCMAGVSQQGFINETTLYLLGNNILLLTICILGATKLPLELWLRLRKNWFKENEIWGAVTENLGLLLLFVASIAYIVASTYNPFLYFRF